MYIKQKSHTIISIHLHCGCFKKKREKRKRRERAILEKEMREKEKRNLFFFPFIPLYPTCEPRVTKPNVWGWKSTNNRTWRSWNVTHIIGFGSKVIYEWVKNKIKLYWIELKN